LSLSVGFGEQKAFPLTSYQSDLGEQKAFPLPYYQSDLAAGTVFYSGMVSILSYSTMGGLALLSLAFALKMVIKKEEVSTSEGNKLKA
jgi:hypothetical protein